MVGRILKKLLSVIDAMGKIGRWPQGVDVIFLDALCLFSRCGTIVVAKVKRNFCQQMLLWERLNRREPEKQALLEELLWV